MFSDCLVASLPARSMADLALAFCIQIGFLIHLRGESASGCNVDLPVTGLAPRKVRECDDECEGEERELPRAANDSGSE